MSLGIFRSIRGPLNRKYADKIIRRLNGELRARGLPEYCDPDPKEANLRRLPCGNAGASTFSALQKFAEGAQLSWTLDRLRGDAQIALPIDFEGSFSIKVGWFIPAVQDFVSVRTIRKEVLALAPVLRIPLTNGEISGALAERIADCDGVSEDEPPGFLENERGLWLDLYFATKYCLEDCAPLVIS
jgi:hypothetical protein